LLDDTDLPMVQLAPAAGFNSVRQMNRVMHEVFRFTPSELRARRREPDRLVVDGGLELRVPYRPPLAWNELLAFLAPRAIPGVESVDLDAGVYRRTVDLDGAPNVIEVWNVTSEHALRLLVGGVRNLLFGRDTASHGRSCRIPRPARRPGDANGRAGRGWLPLRTCPRP